MEHYGVECSRRSDMRLESLWSYHGLAKHGWDGLARGGRVRCGGNRIRRSELAEDKSTRWSHTNQPAAIEPYVGSGVP